MATQDEKLEAMRDRQLKLEFKLEAQEKELTKVDNKLDNFKKEIMTLMTEGFEESKKENKEIQLSLKSINETLTGHKYMWKVITIFGSTCLGILAIAKFALDIFKP